MSRNGLCSLGLNSFAVEMTHVLKEVIWQPEANSEDSKEKDNTVGRDAGGRKSARDLS